MVNFTSSELFEKDAYIYHFNNPYAYNSLEFLNGTYTIIWQRELGVKDASITYVQREQKLIEIKIRDNKEGRLGKCNCHQCQGVFADGEISFGTNTCKFICLPQGFGGQSNVVLKSPQNGSVLTSEPLELALDASLEKGHIIRFGFKYDEFRQRGFKFLEFELVRDYPMKRYLIVAIMAPTIPCSIDLLYNQRLDTYTKGVFKLLKEKDKNAWDYARSCNEFPLNRPYKPGPRTPHEHGVCIHGARDKDAGILNNGLFDESELEENLMGAFDVGAKLGYMKDWVRDELEKSDRRKIALQQSLRYLEPRHSAWMEEIKIREKAGGLGNQLRGLPEPKDRVNKKDLGRRPEQPWWDDTTPGHDDEGHSSSEEEG